MPTRNPEEESDNLQKQVRENSTFPDSDGKNYKTNFIQSTMDLEEMVRDNYKTYTSVESRSSKLSKSCWLFMIKKSNALNE